MLCIHKNEIAMTLKRHSVIYAPSKHMLKIPSINFEKRINFQYTLVKYQYP